MVQTQTLIPQLSLPGVIMCANNSDRPVRLVAVRAVEIIARRAAGDALVFAVERQRETERETAKRTDADNGDCPSRVSVDRSVSGE